MLFCGDSWVKIINKSFFILKAWKYGMEEKLSKNILTLMSGDAQKNHQLDDRNKNTEMETIVRKIQMYIT